MNTNENEITVFGAGQMRTGTASLKKALEHLFNGKCYHMEEVIKNNDISLWQKVTDNKKLDKETAYKIFNGYCCAVDLPVAAFYKDLLEIYPNAKVILSERDPETWLKSVRQTTFKKNSPTIFETIWFHLIRIHKFWNMISTLYPFTFNRTLDELRDDAILKDCFVKHNENVQNVVPKERLLVFKSNEGWEPLCTFLGKEIPEIPYPMVNTSNDFKKMEYLINFYMALKMIVKVFLPIVLVGFAIWYMKK